MRVHRVLLALAAFSLASFVHAEMPLRVISFPGGANLPLWVAEDKGWFAREHLAVKVSPTPNSVELVHSLLANEEDIAMAAFDNIVAYQEGQGEVNLSVTPDFFAFMGFSRGTVRLVVSPDINGYDDLRGKTLGVDAVATGYSLVLQKMLQLGGLKESDDRLELAVVKARRSWAKNNRDALVRFIRASTDAIDWLFDPKNRADAVRIYRKHLPNVP